MVSRLGLPVAYQAQSTLPCDGKPGPCYDHPGAMADQLRFIGALVKSLGQHENIVVWNTWQEIGYWPEMLIGDHVCYCSNTLMAYCSWLRSLYGNDIQALNTHWNVRYVSFDDIRPERSRRRGCVPQEYYYTYFMDNVQIANVLTERCNAIKAADPFHRPVFAHKGGPAYAAGTDWTYARTQDFLGSSFYPAWGSGHPWDDHKQSKRIQRQDALLTEMWEGLSYRMDHTRNANKPGAPVWAAEFQGGPVSTEFHKGRTPDAADMRRWMLTTLGSGATAISFWITRAEIMAPETNGFALLDSEGDSTERFEEAARIGKAVQKHSSLFNNNNVPKAEVGILLDEWKFQQMGSLACAQEDLMYDVRGWYKLLWDNSIACDFIEAGHILEEEMQAYKAIIVPLPLAMSDKVAHMLEAYTKQGGNLLLEAAPGRLNESAFAVRGEINPILREMLQVSQKSFQLVREPSETDRWSPNERTWGEFTDACFLVGDHALSGYKLRANMYLQTLTAASEDHVLFRIGSEAGGVRVPYGKGFAWLIGTYIGPSGTAYKEEDTPRTVIKMLEMCSVQPIHSGKLLVKKRAEGTKEAWFVTNPENMTVTEQIKLLNGKMAVDLLGEPVSQEKDFVEITLDALDVRVLILE